MGWDSKYDENMRRALAMAERAAKLDPFLPYAYWTLGRVYTHLHRHKEAVASLKRAIELAPNYADAHAYFGLLKTYTGNAKEGLAEIDKAMVLNPKAPFWYYFVRGLSLYLLGRHQDAVPVLKQAVDANSAVPWARVVLIAAYGHLGDKVEAEWELDELAVQGLELKISNALLLNTIQDEKYLAQYRADLRKAGVPD
jgi:tetratricopeptide (TPR) repeat protein